MPMGQEKKFTLTKEQQQIAMLAVLLAVIVGVLVYLYHDKMLPSPVNDGYPVTLRPHMELNIVNPGDMFERPDFKNLRSFGDVPVKVLPGNGNPDPFSVDLE